MKGITMQGPSVIATLNGSKTQTRRVIKGYPSDSLNCRAVVNVSRVEWWNHVNTPLFTSKIPYPVGAKRYIREAYWLAPENFNWGHDAPFSEDGKAVFFDYVTNTCVDTHVTLDVAGLKEKSPLSMPERFSRCHIEIVGVRVERVQSISDADVMAEGCLTAPEFIKDGQKIPVMYKLIGGAWRKTKSEAFASYFGQKTWDSNPWVFVYDYKVIWRKP